MLGLFKHLKLLLQYNISKAFIQNRESSQPFLAYFGLIKDIVVSTSLQNEEGVSDVMNYELKGYLN